MLSELERDRISLRDKLATLQAQFDCKVTEAEKLRQDMTSQRDADCNTIAQLQDELNSVKLLYDNEL